MNITLTDSLLGRQRSRQWSPLVTQQYRLRHIQQIFGLNFPHLPKKGAYYYTLHLTTMSAPFYTSEHLDSINPKWPELDQRHLTNLSTTALVIRVWQHCESAADSIVTTWGVNLSGLVYLGNKISEIQPTFFTGNTVIFNIRGGFFTTHRVINRNGQRQPPFIDNVNICEANGDWRLFRNTRVPAIKSEVRPSYNITKLRRLHSLQIHIRNKTMDVVNLREKIKAKCHIDDDQNDSDNTELINNESSPSNNNNNIRYAPQLLTMKSVNRMLEGKPTRVQRQEMLKMRKEIEIAQFRTKLLSQERDKKSIAIRRFKNKLKELVDRNEEQNANLMDSYYRLNKDMDKLKSIRKNVSELQEVLLTIHSQLFHRRRQLLQQLLFIYPIQKCQDTKYTIHGIYLPNSDVLSDCSDSGISVALGYITHILLMASSLLQVPLRYAMTHYGSRSYISDHVSPILPERERDFPLFTKGKEKIQFTYAVYLLNKNIAQLRWSHFIHTPELKATLPNLWGFLEGKECRETPPLITCTTNSEDVILKSDLNHQLSHDLTLKKNYNKMYNRCCESGPGLSEILAIPEAFMAKQISPDSFRNYVIHNKPDDKASIVIKEGRCDESESVCDNETIEEGTDLLDPSLNLSDLDSVDEKPQPMNGESEVSRNLEQWMKNGDDVSLQNSPLTARTDALLNTKSFNLVKTTNKPNL